MFKTISLLFAATTTSAIKLDTKTDLRTLMEMPLVHDLLSQVGLSNGSNSTETLFVNASISKFSTVEGRTGLRRMSSMMGPANDGTPQGAVPSTPIPQKLKSISYSIDNGRTDGLKFQFENESSPAYGYHDRSSSRKTQEIDDSDKIRRITGYWSNMYFEGFEFEDENAVTIGKRFGSRTGQEH